MLYTFLTGFVLCFRMPAVNSKLAINVQCNHPKSPDEIHDLCGGCRKARKIAPCTKTDRCAQCKHVSVETFQRYLDYVERNARRQLLRTTPVKERALPLRSAMDNQQLSQQAPPAQQPSSQASTSQSGQQDDRLVVEQVARAVSPPPASQNVKPYRADMQAEKVRRVDKVKVTDLASLSLNALVQLNYQLPSSEILIKAGLHASTIQIAQKNPSMADMSIREVSKIARSIDASAAASKPATAASAPAAAAAPAPDASGDAAASSQKMRRRTATPQFRMPVTDDETINVDDDDEEDEGGDSSGDDDSADDGDEVGTQTSRSDVDDRDVEPSAKETPDFRELFQFVAANARVGLSAAASESDTIRLVPGALDDQDDDTPNADHLCLTSTALLRNVLRQRHMDVTRELKQSGRITPHKHLGVTMTSYAPGDTVFPCKAPSYEFIEPWFPEVPSSTRVPLVLSDACSLESAARDTVNICDRLNAISEAMVGFLDAVLEDPMFSCAFRFLAKGIMDAQKRSAFVATALMQVGGHVIFRVDGGTCTCTRLSVCRCSLLCLAHVGYG